VPGGPRDLMHPSVPQPVDPVAWAVFTVRKSWPSLANSWPDVDDGELDKIRAKVYTELGRRCSTKERQEELIGEFDGRFVKLTERNKTAPETHARSNRRTRAGRKKAS
jgi:hypothetical protein